LILVDTSVWVDHLREGDPVLNNLLQNGEVLAHPFVIGEIALGSIRQRGDVLSLLEALPVIKIADHDEVMGFISKSKLFGTGIGYVDAHLLASTKLHHSAKIWTRDKRLAETASRFGLAYI
jgi:predicted nucleic acid-binding protein